jgi:hypothetical protein
MGILFLQMKTMAEKRELVMATLCHYKGTALLEWSDTRVPKRLARDSRHG